MSRRAGRGCARWPRSISICGCSANGPTAFTSCAPSSRPSRWPTRSRSPSRRRGRPRSRWWTICSIADNLVVRAARLVMDAMRATGRVEMRLDQAHPDGRGTGRRIERCGGGAAGAARAGRPRARSAEVECHSASSSAATFRSFCWAERRSESAAASELFPAARRTGRGTGLLVAPGIHVNTAQAYRDLSPRLTTELQQNKIVSFQSRYVGYESSGVGAATILKR